MATLKYHSSPCLSLSFSFYCLCIFFLPVSKKIEFCQRSWRIKSDLYLSFSLSLYLSFSLHLSTARDESRGLRVLEKRRPIENPVPTFSFEWKRKEEKRRKGRKRLSEYFSGEEGNLIIVTANYIGRFVTDIFLCRATASSVWSSGEYIQRRCRYGRRDGGALSFSIL